MPTRNIPAQESEVPLPFPVRGLDLSQPFWSQTPGTTPLGQNVRAYEPAGARARGGSRPGLARYIPGQIPGGGLVQELNTVVAVGITAPGAPPGVVQTSSAGIAASGNASVRFQLPVTAGNAILVFAGTTTFSFATVTDSAGNSYSRINGGSFSSAAVGTYLATNVLGGTLTVTASSGPIAVVAVEITGVLGHESNTMSFGTTAGRTTITPWTMTNAPELAYYAVYDTSSHTIMRVAGNGYSDLQTGCVNMQVALIHETANASYGSDLAWTISPSDNPVGCYGGIELSS